MKTADSSIQNLARSKLFAGLNSVEIAAAMKQAAATVAQYPRGAFVFTAGTCLNKLYILSRGKVLLGQDSYAGIAATATVFSEPGEMFGEVYAFLERPVDYFARAETPCEILEIPLIYLAMEGLSQDPLRQRLSANLLRILAEKAYFLNKKLQVLGGGSLRRKLSKLLLTAMSGDGRVELEFSRQALAEYLSVTRPSLSRELMRLQQEGVLRVEGRLIMVLQPEVLSAFL